MISSFKKKEDIFAHPFTWPQSFNLQNYYRAWKIADIGVFLKNSFFLTFESMFLLIVIGMMASFVLSRFHFKLKNAVYLFIILGMMIPVHSVMIPLAYDVGFLHLTNSFITLVLVLSAFSISMTVFILTGFMKSIPVELEESAVMDGYNIPRIFLRVILPLAAPAISTVSIFNFLSAWNNLLFPLIIINDKSLMPLAYGLLSFFAERSSDYAGVMAAVMMSIIPPIVIYLILQEQVQKGLTAGAVKG